MNCREDFHRNFTRIVTHELFIDFDNSAKLNIKLLRVLVGEVKVHHVFAINSELHIDADMENFTRCNVPGNQIPVRGIFILKEIPGLSIPVCPDSSTLSTGRFRHQPQLVVSWNGSRMNLNKLTVRIVYSLLIYRTGGCSCIDYGIRRFAKNNARTTRSQNNSIRSKCNDFHRAQILRGNTAAYSFIVDHSGQKLPGLIFIYETFRFKPANLFIQSIQ
ncbi:hypothetical protein D3C78_1130670 [compost metagenome]